MDRISLLSDDLLLKILSFAPTKVSVTTSLLSKRWRDLWKHVPKLDYFPDNDTEHLRASSFVHNFLLLHKAPVLETLHLWLRNCRPTDIETWIRVAIGRGVRHIKFNQSSTSLGPIRWPRSLYTCKTLVTLTLIYTSNVDVPLAMCFRSLKTFYLTLIEWIGYKGTEAEKNLVMYLLENCGQLKTMAIRPLNSINLEERHKMLQEISFTRRSSSKCQVSFT
ncbi:putative FBD-associated F-box protein At5g56440 [Eutrema salsugineum]|uniref:putative FBD-associated F-box protein At5g56440 n=1 Tax=Eutrema salsugineum TaxID=72664 RepID=UPI000CED644F|nr:putative FBD-associated F-box protein At5g56440 [Eutrema salsugineum]